MAAPRFVLPSPLDERPRRRLRLAGGGGPIVRVDLRAVDHEDGAVHWSSFLLPVDTGKGQVVVGREMCGGAFQLLTGLRYLVRLTAVDAAGNESLAPGEPLAFRGP